MLKSEISSGKTLCQATFGKTYPKDKAKGDRKSLENLKGT
jgi:hypothetical protein